MSVHVQNRRGTRTCPTMSSSMIAAALDERSALHACVSMSMHKWWDGKISVVLVMKDPPVPQTKCARHTLRRLVRAVWDIGANGTENSELPRDLNRLRARAFGGWARIGQGLSAGGEVGRDRLRGHGSRGEDV